MKAVDTNVLARFFVDDPDDIESERQRPAALAAMRAKVFVSVTVLLELEWVLRGFYGFKRPAIQQVLSALCSYANVVIEDRATVEAAIEAYRQGLDFADALHLRRAAHCSAFLTFDKRLRTRAAVVSGTVPCELPATTNAR